MAGWSLFVFQCLEKALHYGVLVRIACPHHTDQKAVALEFTHVSPADMNRIRSVSKVAKDCGRTLIFDSKKTYLLLYMNHPEILYPGLPVLGKFMVALSRLKLYASRYSKYGLPQDLYAESYTDYRQAHEAGLLVSQRGKQKDNPDLIYQPDDVFIWGPLREEILREPGRYLLYTSSGAHTLLHFLPSDGRSVTGTYVYGKAEPFKKEMELSFRRLLKWIELCGLKLEYAHTSGHMYPRDLERLVLEIDPKVVVPIHAEYPCLFRNWSGEVHIPSFEGTLEVKNREEDFMEEIKSGKELCDEFFNQLLERENIDSRVATLLKELYD